MSLLVVHLNIASISKKKIGFFVLDMPSILYVWKPQYNITTVPPPKSISGLSSYARKQTYF